MRHLLRPIFDRVIIKEPEPDRVRRSGLGPARFLRAASQHGIVLAIGLGLDWWESAGVQTPAARRSRRLPRLGGKPGRGSTRRSCSFAGSASLGVLEEIGTCPYCGDKGLAGSDACPVCGRSPSSPPAERLSIGSRRSDSNR